MEHAQNLIGCIGRVGEWAENVENGAHAQGFAHRRNVFHRAVVVGGEHKAHADFIDTLRHLFRREVHRHAHVLHDVGCAARRRHGSTAVFGDARARTCGHKHRSGGNIKGLCLVAACAHNIHQLVFVQYGHFGGKIAHHGGRSGNFRHGFHFDAQAYQ